MQHILYAFGVEFHKDASGAVPFLIWASIVAGCGSFTHKPFHVAILHLCSNANMLYMFLGQKSLRIIMVLFNCIFGKYKNGSGGIPPHVPLCSPVPLYFAS